MTDSEHTPYFEGGTTYQERWDAAKRQLAQRKTSVEPEFETYPDGSARLIRGWNPNNGHPVSQVLAPLEWAKMRDTD